MTRNWGLLAVTLVVLTGVTACSGPSRTPADENAEAPSATPSAPASVEPLTEADYKKAFTSFRECTRSAGVDLIISGEDNHVIQYAFAAEDEGAVDKCYSAGFAPVDIQWQQQQLAAG